MSENDEVIVRYERNKNAMLNAKTHIDKFVSEGKDNYSKEEVKKLTQTLVLKRTSYSMLLDF